MNGQSFLDLGQRRRQAPLGKRSDPNIVQVNTDQVQIEIQHKNLSRMSQPQVEHQKYSSLIINLSVNSPVINQVSGLQQPIALDNSSLNSSRWLRSRLAGHNNREGDGSDEVYTMQESSEYQQSGSDPRSHGMLLTLNTNMSKLISSSPSSNRAQKMSSGSQTVKSNSLKGSINSFASKSGSDCSLSPAPEKEETK